MSMFYRASTAIIAQELTIDLGLSPKELGLLGSAFFYAFALIQLPLGLLLDRAGARITMVALNILGILGAVILANGDNVVDGVIGRILMGLGMAANFMGPLKLLTHWFSLKKFATVSGLMVSIGSLGSMAATSPLAFLVEELGWRDTFRSLAGFHFLLIVCFLLVVRDKPDIAVQEKTFQPSPLASIKRLFSNWNYWAISFSTFLRYGSFAAIQTLWAGPFLMWHLNIPQLAAGNLILMLGLGYIIGAPTGGLLSDRILKSRKKAVMYGVLCSATATVALLLWQDDSLLLWLGAVLFAMGFFNSFGQVSYAHIRDIMPDEMAGTALSGINFFTMMGGGLFIHGFGSVMERVSPHLTDTGDAYRIIFLLCVIALVASVVLYATTRDKIPQT
jgi:nitrate/nitrite transporter NarK